MRIGSPLLQTPPRDRVGASSLARPNVPDAQIGFESGNLSFDELDFGLQAVEAGGFSEEAGVPSAAGGGGRGGEDYEEEIFDVVGDFSGLGDPVADSFVDFLPGVGDLEDGLQLPELHLDHLDSAAELGDVACFVY